MEGIAVRRRHHAIQHSANDSNDGCEDAGERLLFIRQAVGKQTADHPSHYAAANEERDNVGGCHDAG